VLDQSVRRSAETIATARVVVAAVRNGRAARLPKVLLAAFTGPS
jgi:acyl-CoA thioesterase FadM